MLAPGTRVGPYEITAVIGEGGMGQVYRATDTKLKRQVAIKILPPSLAADRDRRARLQREAQVLASLNHPHIAQIYGLETSNDVDALVMELVEGPTLADRIARGALPADEALAIARQLTEALEAAHEQSVVHRDLKPANIKVRSDGTVKVLDFGLAKAAEPASAPSVHTSTSPTITTPAIVTGVGMILGTAAYMSPEQARGTAVDKRADIWAFGCVLYEMLTGLRAFDDKDQAAVLGAVVHLEPDWDALPRTVPPAVGRLLKRCLQKDMTLRARDIADVRFELDEAFAGPISTAGGRARTSGSIAHAGWVAAALVAMTAAVAMVWLPGRAPDEPPEARLQIVTPPTSSPASLAISPDGRSVVFQARVDGRPMLWLRPLASEEARPLMGTEGGTMPFWSPDSQSIGFFADQVMKRIDLANGFVRMLASAPFPRRGSWNSEGTILFAPGSTGPLYRVQAEGGAATPATELLPGQTSHRFPEFLPDGQRFLTFVLGATDVRGLYAGSLDSVTISRVADRESAYAVLSPEHVLFARQGGLWARRTNGTSMADAAFVPIAPRAFVFTATTGFGALSASATGAIAYRASAGTEQFVYLDRSGRTVRPAVPPVEAPARLWSLAADGRLAALERATDGNQDVWLADAERGVFRRLTNDPALDTNPVLSPDGTRVVYVTDGKADVNQIHERRADGTGGATLLFESEENKNPLDWSSDGRYILFGSQSSTTDRDLWALPLSGDRRPFEIARSNFVEEWGRFSPDGRWVVYASNEPGRSEVFVQPFPGPGPKLQVSSAGGTIPRWRRDGTELFYIAPDNRLMVVALSRRGPTLDAAVPRALFSLPAVDSYEPAPDGQHFLVRTIVSEASPITVILNWKPPSP